MGKASGSNRGKAIVGLAKLQTVHFPDAVNVPSAEDFDALNASKRFAASLDEGEIGALQRYTGEGYKAIRAAMTGELGASHEAQIDAAAIKSAMAKTEKVERVVYRGMSLTNRQLKEVMAAKDIYLHSPTSATRDHTIAQDFIKNTSSREKYGVLLRVTQRSGAPLDAISMLGGGEREVLLPARTRLKITKLQQTFVNLGSRRIPTLVVHAKEE